jgi:tRNA A37 threonylcarbamoyladenosine synthetase subunit TsaC/SUA5/YrdC/protein-tyrosine-phosphatase
VEAPAFLDPERAAARARLAAWLAEGRVVALPTDTVPGLAASAAAGGAPAAAARIARLKAAPEDKPCALHLADRAALARWLPSLPPGLPRWMERTLPGPWTVVLPVRWVPRARELGWSWPQVGVRVPDHAGFRACARAAADPLLMSSVNPHGAPPLHGAALADWLREHGVPAAFDPLRIASGAPSTVLAFEPLPRVVRGTARGDETQPGLRVLVVCSGNSCRSPLAAALLRRELAAAWGVGEPELARLGWIVESAGTFAMPGTPASEHSVSAAREVGLELGGHRARSVQQAVAGAPPDLVLGMGRNHVAALSDAGHPAELFDPAGHEVGDPFGGELADYRRAREHLQRAAQDRIETWSRWTAGQRD